MTRNVQLLVVLAAAQYAFAQTSTTCNPLNATCAGDPALGSTFYSVFNTSMTEFDPKVFNVTAGTELISFSEEGAEMTIAKSGDSVTVQTQFYIMFGQVEVLMKAASGQGIISTFNMLSDDLDEIDWEIMGGNTSFVENNYYGWGNQSQANAEYVPTSGANWNGGAMGGVHNYTVNWSKDSVQWILDGNVVRTAPYQPPGQWPQTPSYLKFGIWAGGDPSGPPGRIAWAGGETDYSKGPFVMTLQSIKVTDAATNVSSYTYGDQSGSWQSIKATPGQSDVYNAIHKESYSQKVEQHWSGLSKTGKIAVAASVLGAFALFMIAFTFYCISQRKKGRNEKAIADRAWDAQNAELQEYRNRMKRGDFAIQHMGHGEKF